MGWFLGFVVTLPRILSWKIVGVNNKSEEYWVIDILEIHMKTASF